MQTRFASRLLTKERNNMANKIEKELKLSLQYDLKRCEGRDDLVQFTTDNVARVEAMIRNDSDYSDKGTRTVTDWLTELSNLLKGKSSTEDYQKVIFECVSGIDRTNSTHINADGVGRDQLTERIVNINKQQLYQYLKEPENNNYKLISILSEKTVPKDVKMRARCNYSFATKFCHYTAFNLFEGEIEQDNFSIYDSIVARNIQKYAQYYGVKVPRDIGNNYISFIKLVDEIIIKSGGEISRNGFDHLLWYFHKAR